MEDTIELENKIDKLFLLVEQLSATHDIQTLPQIQYLIEQIADIHNTTINEIERSC